jgi:hypothetical protein
MYPEEGPAVVLYPAVCARLLLWFPQPKRKAREEKTVHLIPSASTASARRWLIRRPSFRRVTRPFSTVTVEDLEALVSDDLLRPLSGGPQPEWTAPESEADLTPSPGYMVSFIPFHERGFGVPASRFMRALLHHYGVELHNFNPNSIAQAAIFTAVCEGFLGIDPHWDLWTHLFSAEFFDASTDVKKVRMAVRADGCTLQLRFGRAQ